MSEQETPRTVEEAAREEAERRWPSYPVVGFSGPDDRQAAFIAGAAWQAARVPSVEEVAEVLAEHYGSHWCPTCGPTTATREGGPRWHAPTHLAERVVALWGGGERG